MERAADRTGLGGLRHGRCAHGGEVLRRATSEGRRIGVVPLFLAPGLLLDQVTGEAYTMGAQVASPLGTALAELVLQRYLETLAVMPA